MISRAAGHRTHRERLQLDPLAIKIGMRFVAVDWDLDAKLVTLRDKSLATPEALLLLTPLDILTNCPLGCCASRHLQTDTFPDALGSVALLARRLAVGGQNFVNKRLGLRRRQVP